MRVHWLWLLLSLYGVNAEDDAPADGEEDGEAEEEDGEEEAKEILIDGLSAEQREKMTAGAENHDFRAETQRVLDILVNSLYTNKGVYLRELLSNSMDALEKARFLSIQDQDFLGEYPDLEVRVEVDTHAKTLSIQDSGIGMSKEELVTNLGTVAKSGTTNFLEALKEGADASLIGQFGVGFYSCFLVADKVTVTSVSKDSKAQHVWESGADGSFTVAEDPRGTTLGRGTRVTLHMKEEAHSFLEIPELESSIKKYSQFMMFPILVKVEKAADKDEELDDDDDAPKQQYEWKKVNNDKPLWLQPKEDIKKDEYTEFFRTLTGQASATPLMKTHFSAEGEIEFTALLYVPSQKPFSRGGEEGDGRQPRVKLYVRRVLVAEGKEADVLPKWLNFVEGIIDSDDLPLNVNREQLQQNKILKVIRKKSVRKVLEMLRKESELDEFPEKGDEDDEAEGEGEEGEKKKRESTYTDFWKTFATDVRYGCFEDDANRGKVAKLLRFDSSYTVKEGEKKTTSLDGYVARMLEKQTMIYYAAGDSSASVDKMPAMQIFQKKGIEVLYFTSVHDEPCISKLAEYEGYKLVSIQKGETNLGDLGDDKERLDNLKKMYETTTKWWQDFLKADSVDSPGKWMNVQDVRITNRLVNTPVALVTSQFGYSAKMEKAYASQGQDMTMSASKTLEINPDHPVIYQIYKKVKESPDDESAKKTAELLTQAAILASGYRLEDPSNIVASVQRLLKSRRGADHGAPVDEVEIPADHNDDQNPAGAAAGDDEAGADDEDEDAEDAE
jgi:heat shock protein beta